MHFIQDTAYSLTALGANMFSVQVTNNGPDTISSVLGTGTISLNFYQHMQKCIRIFLYKCIFILIAQVSTLKC